MAADGQPHHDHVSAPVEIDLDDVQVPLTVERALGLQAELYLRLSTRQFQGVLRDYKERLGERTPEFRKLRQLLVLGVQKEVLPKYGYPGTLEGVAQMMEAVKALEGHPQIKSNLEVLNHLIGGAIEDVAWLSEHGPEVAKLDHLSHAIAPHEEQSPVVHAQADPHSLAVGPRPVGDAADHVPAAPHTGIGVELDVDDISVPLTKERVLALQRELMTGFQAQEFQDRLHALEAHYPPNSSPALAMEFRRERQHLVLGVQSRVLPKYGYAGSLEGVAQMLHDIKDKFPDDSEINANIQAIDRLILASASRSPSPSGRRQVEPDAKAVAKPSPRRGTLFKHVTEKDGYWVVVGGTKSGGLLVRLAEDTHSKAWPELLATGAVVKEVQRLSDRMHYEKVLGDGPNYGWVTIRVKDHDLLVPYRGEVPDLRA